MKKWVLVLIIVLIVFITFLMFALQYDFGSSIIEKARGVFSGNSIPLPPALPD